jgi:type VI secretion system secreted protein Hcp
MSSNMYVKFEAPDIAGSSTEPGHSGEIDVLTWSHGFAQSTSTSRSSAGAGTGEQASHQDLTFTKYLDSATHVLVKYCWSGQQFGKVTLTCFRVDGASGNRPVEYLRVEMEHVIVSNYSVSGGPGDVPVENVSLDYGIIAYHYTPQHQSDALRTTQSAKHNLENRTIE